jgi:hypothetical protein
MEAAFESAETFSGKYQRNNKRGGLKNLRCFPTCAAMHRERGFCGRPVTLGIKLPIPNLTLMDLACFAVFVPTSHDELPKSAKSVGDVIGLTEALALVRDKDNPTRPWVDGSIVENSNGNRVQIVFNKEK